MGMLKYKGYTGSVEFSNEDNCLYGKVQGLHGTILTRVLLLMKFAPISKVQ